MKRFINADTYASTGQGFLGYNMFAYCDNNPIVSADPLGDYRIAVIYDGSQTDHNGYGTDGYAYSCLLTLASLSPFIQLEVETYSYYDGDGFVDSWNSLEGTYDLIVIYGHGSQYQSSIWFEKPNNRIGLGTEQAFQYSSLKPVRANKMQLNVCYAAKAHPEKNQLSTAQYFANLTGATVTACSGIVITRRFDGYAHPEEGYSWEYISPNPSVRSIGGTIMRALV